MSKKGKTETILIIDRSGSMSSIKGDMEGGLNAFIEDQKKVEGENYVTYYQFDDEFEKVFELKSIEKVGSIKINPRGMTALVDAVGRGVNETISRIERTTESEKPEAVLVYIITDGYENASREYTNDKVKALIKKAEDDYGFKFMFLGADIDSFSVGGNWGLDSSKVMNYTKSASGTTGLSATMSKSATYYRCSVAESNFSSVADYKITDEDRKEAMK